MNNTYRATVNDTYTLYENAMTCGCMRIMLQFAQGSDGRWFKRTKSPQGKYSTWKEAYDFSEKVLTWPKRLQKGRLPA